MEIYRTLLLDKIDLVEMFRTSRILFHKMNSILLTATEIFSNKACGLRLKVSRGKKNLNKFAIQSILVLEIIPDIEIAFPFQLHRGLSNNTNHSFPK